MEEKKIKIGDVWMTEKEAGELYDDLMDMFSGRTHFRLLAVAADPATEVFVADTDGNLVVKGVGRVDEPLAGGFYDVRFGDGGLRRTRLSSYTRVDE